MVEPFRLLACGARDYTDKAAVFATLDRAHAKRPVSVLIHGAARGADTLAGLWAEERGITVAAFPAAWRNPDGTQNKAADPIRNQRMLDEGRPDACVAFPPGPKLEWSGTADMVTRCLKAGLPVWRVGWPAVVEAAFVRRCRAAGVPIE